MFVGFEFELKTSNKKKRSKQTLSKVLSISSLSISIRSLAFEFPAAVVAAASPAELSIDFVFESNETFCQISQNHFIKIDKSNLKTKQKIMKFGDVLEKEMKKEWRDEYVDYAGLKQLIKRMTKKQPSNEINESLGNGNTNNISNNNNTSTAATSTATGSTREVDTFVSGAKFVEALKIEIEKVTRFAEKQEGIYKTRLRALDSHREHLRGWKNAQLPDVDSLIEKLANDYAELGRDVASLLQYVVLNGLGIRKILKKLERYTGQNSTSGLIVDVTDASGWLKRLSDSTALTELVSGVQTSLALTNELRVWQGPTSAGGSMSMAPTNLAIPPGSTSVTVSPNSSADEEEKTALVNGKEEKVAVLRLGKDMFGPNRFDPRRLYPVFHSIGAFLSIVCWVILVVFIQIPGSALMAYPLAASLVATNLLSAQKNYPRFDEIWCVFFGYLSGSVGMILLYLREAGILSLPSPQSMTAKDMDDAMMSDFATLFCACALMGIPSAIFSLSTSNSRSGEWVGTCAIVAGIFYSFSISLSGLGMQFTYLILGCVWGLGFLVLFGYAVSSESFRRSGEWIWFDTKNNRAKHEVGFVFAGRLIWSILFLVAASRENILLFLLMAILSVVLTFSGRADVPLTLSVVSFLADFCCVGALNIVGLR